MLHQISISKCQDDSLWFYLTKGGVQGQVVYVGHIVHPTEIASGLESSLLSEGLSIEHLHTKSVGVFLGQFLLFSRTLLLVSNFSSLGNYPSGVRHNLYSILFKNFPLFTLQIH